MAKYSFRVLKTAQDRELARQAITHPRVYTAVSDDQSSSRETFRLPDGITCVGVFQENDFLGCFSLTPHTGICYEVHTSLLPSAWGHAVELSRLSIVWLWKNTKIKRLITSVGEDNPLALRLAKKCGFIEIGINPNSIEKSGKLLGMHILGLSKEYS